MKTLDDNLTTFDPTEDADDLRDALRTLSGGLHTPTPDLVAAGTVRGRELRRRRTLVRVVAPLAVAAMVTPLGFAATQGIPMPRGGDQTMEGARVTVLDPGRPAPSASADSATAATSTTVAPESFPLPTPTGDATFAVGQEEAPEVLLGWVSHLLGRQATGVRVQTARLASGSEAPPQALLDLIATGRSKNSYEVAIAVDDPGGASMVRVYVMSPDAMNATGPCESGCTDDTDGQLRTSSEDDGEQIYNTATLTTRDGWQVLATSSNADGVVSLGAQVTRSAPLLSVEQLTEMARWEGWRN